MTVEYYKELAVKWQAEAEADLREIERLRGLLRIHGQHLPMCASLMYLLSNPPKYLPCNCGLADAITTDQPQAVTPNCVSHQWEPYAYERRKVVRVKCCRCGAERATNQPSGTD
jgi:hypothetical protein